jgi:hypothetical protein
MIIWFLSLILFRCWITFIDLCTLNHSFIPGMKPILLWCMVFLMCCWIQFASILLRVFASVFIKRLVNNSLFVMSLSCFGMSVILALKFTRARARAWSGIHVPLLELSRRLEPLHPGTFFFPWREDTGVWTMGFTFVRQGLYLLSHTSRSLEPFWEAGSHGLFASTVQDLHLKQICSSCCVTSHPKTRWLQTTFFFPVLGFELTLSHSASPFFCDGFFQGRVSQTICLGWLWTTVLLISASWVARITGKSHQHSVQATNFCFVQILWVSEVNVFQSGSSQHSAEPSHVCGQQCDSWQLMI